MTFFNKVFNQSKKGLGKAILFGIIMGLILAISMFIYFKGTTSKVLEETECKLVDYELTCKVEKYDKVDGVLIDLNYNEDNDEKQQIILTREKMIIQGQTYLYQDLFAEYGEKDSLNMFVNTFMIILSVMFFIGGSIFYLIGNLILALVMMALINSIMKTNFKFDQMYKLTIYTSFPYVLFNGITRVLFGFTVSGIIPFFLVSIVIDYTIIFFITYLVVKKGYVPEVEEPKVELPFEG